MNRVGAFLFCQAHSLYPPGLCKFQTRDDLSGRFARCRAVRTTFFRQFKVQSDIAGNTTNIFNYSETAITVSNFSDKKKKRKVSKIFSIKGRKDARIYYRSTIIGCLQI